MWTITLQSYHYEDERKNITNKTVTHPELFSGYSVTLMTLLWSTFGLIEPDNIEIKYNNNADSYLKVCIC